MPHDPFAAAVHTAHEWLRAVADGLETDDLAFAHRALHGILCGGGMDASAFPSERGARQRDTADQSMLVQDRVRALGDAVAALARGSEQLPIDTGDANRVASAAQEAHRILPAEGLVPGVRQH